MNNLFLVPLPHPLHLTCIGNIPSIYYVYLQIILTYQSKWIDINICHVLFFLYAIQIIPLFSLRKKKIMVFLPICLSFLVWIPYIPFDHLLMDLLSWQIWIEHLSCSQTGLDIGRQLGVFPALWKLPLLLVFSTYSSQVPIQTLRDGILLITCH